MNRVIKFRAWNKIHNIMMKWENLRNQYNTLNCLTYEHLEVMQYTGLKDKNDKEIYEGDILVMSYETNILGTKTIRNKVEWKGYSDGEYVDNVECWMCGNYPVSDWNTKDLEVIGNIYENPELLKE